MSNKCTVSGEKPAEGTENLGAPQPINPDTGQHKDHYIACDADRKDFIRPVRREYIHTKCGAVTTMPQKIAETWAADLKFYGRTFCVACREYLPVSEFVWDDDRTVLGT